LRALVHQTRSGRVDVSRRALSLARRLWLTQQDPTVSYDIGGTTLHLPLSHLLPVYRASHPDYSMNLARVVKVVAAAEDATIVDIGANVGDSAAIVRTATDVPILAVEGDLAFLPYLRENAALLGDIEIAPSYVRSADQAGPLAVERVGGTARLVAAGGDAAADPATLEARSLEEILDRHPRFARPTLVKIDTDGHDVGIITDSQDVLRRTQPVLFFELDVAMTRDTADADATKVFPMLAELGYRRALFYGNLGPLVIGLDASAWGEVPTLARLPEREPRVAYFDVCAFPAHRLDECHRVEQGELERSSAAR
jgi:FkbM family methyltransferase